MENRKTSSVPEKRALTPTPPPTTRREALHLGLYSLVAGGFVYMAWRFIRGGQMPVTEICFPRAPEKETALLIGGVYLVRLGKEVQAFSSRCPHLGCRLSYQARTRRFECPCHGSVFSLGGHRITGPARTGMTALDIKMDKKCGAYRVLVPLS